MLSPFLPRLSPPLFFLSLSLFLLPTTESLEQAMVKKVAVTGVRLVGVGRQKRGSSGLAGTKLKYWWMAVTGQIGECGMLGKGAT